MRMIRLWTSVTEMPPSNWHICGSPGHRVAQYWSEGRTISDRFPFGPHNSTEAAVMRQNIDTVGTSRLAAMCIGPVLDDTTTDDVAMIAMSSRSAILPMRFTSRGEWRAAKAGENPTSLALPVTTIQV